jgi:hypothetical protein
MIEAKDITKMVQHVVRRDSGKSDAVIMHPLREWALGLFVVGLLVLWGVIFTVALFRVYSSSLETVVPVPVMPIPYKAPLVAETILQYEKERTQYKAMVGVVPPTLKDAPLGATGTTTETTTPATPVVESELIASSTADGVPVSSEAVTSPDASAVFESQM